MTENTHLSDQQLAIDARNGDLEAFRAIVLRYSNAMLSVAFSVLGDFHEAQDVTQEAFVKCFHRLHTLKDPARLGSWLYSIAYRTSLDFLKKKKAALPYSETIALHTDDVRSWLDRHVMKQSIWRALQTLDEKSRTDVVLYYVSDWSMKQIGQFLHLSVPAVESRLRRAKEAMKLHLADDFASYFRPYRLGRRFEQTVCEQVLKRMGHFYIPVTNKKQTTDWFVRHFHLAVNTHGNLLLESGHELYLLECQTHTPPNMPVLTFAVSNIHDLWSRLKSDGVVAGPIETNEWFGKHFVFYDPDGNQYHTVENQ